MGDRSSNLEVQKNRILQILDSYGPSVPMRIASDLKLDSILTSAFLADLLSDKQIKISYMRVGNSPIYYLPGQEDQLEKFVQYLNQKEREAFELVKHKKVLIDNMQLPAIRVALRSIKDFAFPIIFSGYVFWRFRNVTEQEALSLINTINLPSLHQVQDKIPENKIEVQKIEILKVPEVKQIPQINIEVKKEIKEKKVKKLKVKERPEFVLKVEDLLSKEGISINKNLIEKKKEYSAIIKSDKGVEYLCIAKDKKSVTDKELIKQLQAGQKKNLPVLFISSGEASKKAVEWLDYLGNLIIYKKLE